MQGGEEKTFILIRNQQQFLFNQRYKDAGNFFKGKKQKKAFVVYDFQKKKVYICINY